MTDSVATLQDLHDHLWSRLVAGVGDRTAASRHLTLAAQGADGWPEARTVVLRRADPAAAMLEVHTDLKSPKVASFAALPRAALHVWDPLARLQIRLRAEVSVHSGSEVASVWESVPEASRGSYGATPPPGTPIPGALDYAASPDPAAFAVLRCRAIRIDVLHLGVRHRRALFQKADGWAGQWLSP